VAADYHYGQAEMAEAILESVEGGRWFERGIDGPERDWGRVLVWEPPQRLVVIGQTNGQGQYDPDPDHASEIEVRHLPQPECLPSGVRHWEGIRPRPVRRSRWVAWSSSSGIVVSCLASLRSRTGEPLAVVLLGDHAGQGGLHVGPDRGDRVLFAQVRDGVLQSAAVVRQFIRREGVQGMFRLVNCQGLLCGFGGWHRMAVPSCAGWAGVFSLPNVSGQ
jgi:hypothetical protein